MKKKLPKNNSNKKVVRTLQKLATLNILTTIEINMKSHGEADLIKDIMSKKVKMSIGIKRLLLSKTIGAVNKKLKGKKVDKAMKERLELENTRHKELMQKALKDNKISKKDYDWFIANCMYDTKGIKVVEPKN